VETRTGGRAIELVTAIALGVVSVVTALGVVQATAWDDTASRYALDAADARDQGVAIAVTTQLKQRSDRSALLEARRLAAQSDAAFAAGDLALFAAIETDITATLGNSVDLPEGSFDAWRVAGFPDDAWPTESAEYLVETRGDVDALALTSQRLGDLAAVLKDRAAIFGQASLVHAVALFLFGVAGINRLRLARYVTLSAGALVFVFGLFLMSTAY